MLLGRAAEPCILSMGRSGGGAQGLQAGSVPTAADVYTRRASHLWLHPGPESLLLEYAILLRLDLRY